MSMGRALRKGIGKPVDPHAGEFKCLACVSWHKSRAHLEIHVKYHHEETTIEELEAEEEERLERLRAAQERNSLPPISPTSSRASFAHITTSSTGGLTERGGDSPAPSSVSSAPGEGSAPHPWGTHPLNPRRALAGQVKRTISVIEEQSGIGHAVKYVQGAVLELFQREEGEKGHQYGGYDKIRSGKTSAKGRCGLKIVPGRYLLEVSHPQYKCQRVGVVVPDFDAPRVAEIPIELESSLSP